MDRVEELELKLAELESQAKSAEARATAYAEFLTRMSHELRTPLNAIVGFSDVMADETYGPLGHERYKDYLGYIRLSASHLVSLINDLLDLHRIAAGRLSLQPEPVDLHTALREAAAILEPQAHARGIAILIAPAPDQTVQADPRALRQVLLNILGNSLKYAAPGEPVTVRVQNSSEGTRIVLADNGPGMSAADLLQVLSPFERGAAARSGAEGSGLGLPIAKGLTEAMGAQFDITSRVGHGTAVTLTFPSKPGGQDATS